MISDYLNSNFWSLYFHNNINSLISCLRQLCLYISKFTKNFKGHFQGHWLFYLWVNIMRLEFVFDILTVSSFTIFNCITYSIWFLVLFLFYSLLYLLFLQNWWGLDDWNLPPFSSRGSFRFKKMVKKSQNWLFL